jgi:hypothetical protein
MRLAIRRTPAAALVVAALFAGCERHYGEAAVADDAGSDGGANGASDGASDAAAEADTGPQGFCATRTPRPTFCSDFDTLDLPAGWTTPAVYGPGSVFVDSLASTSSPRSFLGVFAASSMQGSAALRKTLADVTGNVELDLDFRIEAHDGNRLTIAVLELEDDASGRNDNLTLRWHPTEGVDLLEVAERPGNMTAYAGTSRIAAAATSFTHVRVVFAIDASASATSVTLIVDGVSTTQSGLLAHEYRSRAALLTGITYLPSASTTWRVRLDDVVLDMK